ncbi:hypothetical protein F751_3444 [Auxenochlorella protothecoides]|uniref:Uncharacterized protein n=1 Tax=Auxenochlorella protothecoides TaxID=3075 RepID=A0A087SBZ9_AUXPR|nr:hypothetical protein F751_3444 [Auxenochlorella protothecoides]KFM23253.1 hypothetical protein F751_3444 [Auxenochlorella protothecoides]
MHKTFAPGTANLTPHLMPSGVWWFSRMQHSVRSVAVRVELSRCTYSFLVSPAGPLGVRMRMSRRRDCMTCGGGFIRRAGCSPPGASPQCEDTSNTAYAGERSP